MNDSKITFTFQKVAAALIKAHDLHEGLWEVSLDFDIDAAYVRDPAGQARPTALIPVRGIGLKRVSGASDLTADAAKVNPKPKARARGR